MSAASETPIQTWHPHPSAPAQVLPGLACDAHVHVFGPSGRFPFAPSRNYTPADASKESLFALHRHLGISRCVIVQAGVHGMDNTVVEDAILAGSGRYLGIALTPTDIADAELMRLSQAGFRGVRFNFMKHLGRSASTDEILALGRRLEPLGMHLQVHFESSLVHELCPIFARSAVPVVIDHMGRVDATLGANHADFAALEHWMAHPNFLVKVSGIDRIDATPPYTHGMALARRLVERFPERCLWGSDWPHPNHTHIPDDGVLVDALAQIAPSPDHLQALLVDNPQHLYRFEA